jgi:hypothetical protein
VEDGKDKVIPGDSHPDYRKRCRQVFGAVLDEDAAHLPTLEADIEALRLQLDALGGQP